MAAPTEVYVDPSIAGDSGAGTIGDPYGDLEYALATVTQDATNGNRINIKAGTDEVLSAALAIVANYGTPTISAPLIFQGYTSAAGDGGIGGISGGESVGIHTATLNYVYWFDLHLHNCGSNNCLVISRSSCGNLEVNNLTGNGIVAIDGGSVFNCNVYNIAGVGVNTSSASKRAVLVDSCYFKNDATNKFTSAIELSDSSLATRNIVSVDSTSNGIKAIGSGAHHITNNSLFSNGGESSAAIFGDGTTDWNAVIANNLIEGWSGTAGKDIDRAPNARFAIIYGNGVFNVTNTEYDDIGQQGWLATAQDNQVLTVSPFAQSGSDTFANRFTYFAPTATDAGVIGGAYPAENSLDKGAAQHADTAATTVIIKKTTRIM